MTRAATDQLFVLIEPSWFSAVKIHMRGGRYLSVYRSVLVEDTSEIYSDVKDMLRYATLIASDTNDDDDMMFGRAEWQLWKL